MFKTFFVDLLSAFCYIQIGDYMKYYEYSSAFELEYDKIKKYIVDIDASNEVFKLAFEDSQINEFYDATDGNWAFELGISAYFIGEDSFFYEFKPDGSVHKSKKCTDKMHNQLWNSRLKIATRIRKDKLYSNNIINKYDKTVNLLSKSVNEFDKYIYINSSRNYVIPFRFKKARSDNAPLLVYFHGAGCLGHDNFKPLFEYKNFLRSKDIPDCNILIPQAFYGANFSNSNITDYVNNCVDLINVLINNNIINKDCVYCFGTSFGACCVWYSISLYPEIFAAAVPVMGIITEYKKYLPVLKEHNTIPIWIAHSSNDSNVSIVTDDYIFSHLKGINPNIKYTRWDKYGHKMATHFYKSEPFIEWMFSHSLEDR